MHTFGNFYTITYLHILFDVVYKTYDVLASLNNLRNYIYQYNRLNLVTQKIPGRQFSEIKFTFVSSICLITYEVAHRNLTPFILMSCKIHTI